MFLDSWINPPNVYLQLQLSSSYKHYLIPSIIIINFSLDHRKIVLAALPYAFKLFMRLLYNDSDTSPVLRQFSYCTRTLHFSKRTDRLR